MEMYLRCAIHDPHHWCRWLPTAEFWYNSSFHASINCTPFKALYGTEPNLGATVLWDDKTAPVIDNEQWDWGVHTARLRAQLLRAQCRFKKKADRHRTERSFQVGEDVLLKLQPYAQSSVVNRPRAKLAYKFFGPFEVEAKIGTLAYRLILPPDNRIHNVFHVSQLKPYTPNYAPVFTELPKPPDLSTVKMAPVKILDRRMGKRGNAALVQRQVRWNSSSPSATTWEDYDTLKLRFPTTVIWQGAAGAPGDAPSEEGG
uniref:Tf2-1-like SH3-like domain-containing protein n=1 Tax=Triticum urartu TaxID=4572 RepID=A0A8R7TR31_TRIUA